jgi:hypothetical protein
MIFAQLIAESFHQSFDDHVWIDATTRAGTVARETSL